MDRWTCTALSGLSANDRGRDASTSESEAMQSARLQVG